MEPNGLRGSLRSGLYGNLYGYKGNIDFTDTFIYMTLVTHWNRESIVGVIFFLYKIIQLGQHICHRYDRRFVDNS